MSKFAKDEKVLPVLAPADIVATATNTQYLDLNNCVGIVEFDFQFGVVTSTDSTGEVVVTMTANPVADTSSSDSVETALAFQYRLSAAVGTDTLGSLTAVANTGVAVANTDDNKLLAVFIDPAAVAAAASGARFVRGVLTPTAETTVCIVGAVARHTPRYAGASIPSST